MNKYKMVSIAVGLALALAGLLLPVLARAGYAAAPSEPVERAPVEAAVNVTYTVNATGDTVLTSGCVSGPNPCTLRGALQLANGSGATNKLIIFAPSLNGVTITLGSTLYITGGAITIDGSGRETTVLHGPANQPAFLIQSSNNTISDLMVTGYGAFNSNEDGVRLVQGSANALTRLTLINFGGNGIWTLSSSANNDVTANYLGTYSSGGVINTQCIFGNDEYGLMVSSGGNSIGGNIIGCNHYDGVYLNGPNATDNLLVLNEIGVAPNGHNIANSGHGVNIENGAANNKIGVDGALGTNVIAGNLANGVHIGGGSSSGNSVRNNLIGLSPTGTFAVANINSGVQIDDGAHDNIIGGRVLTEANTISGNGGTGIYIHGIGAGDATDTRKNSVFGNRIGLNAAGTLTVPNFVAGVYLDYGAISNTIGIVNDAYRNTISGHAGDGVTLKGVRGNNVQGNTLTGNQYAGINIENSSLSHINSNDISGGGFVGILISGTNATTNTLHGNDVWNQQAWGIGIWLGAHANTVEAGRIYSNGAGVVLVYTNTTGNLITGTQFYSNIVGIAQTAGSSSNVWSHLSTHDHWSLGVDIDTLYALTGPFPTITSITANGGQVTVHGKASPAILQSVKVELYRASLTASGQAEGRTYLGEDMADANGDWSVTFTGSNGCFTAFQTVQGFLQAHGSSGEFGSGNCRTLLPVVTR